MTYTTFEYFEKHSIKIGMTIKFLELNNFNTMNKDTIGYSKNKDITILWMPSKCVHAGICVKSLPTVYNPKGKPWITPESVDVKNLKAQIDRCPTGALQYRLNKED